MFKIIALLVRKPGITRAEMRAHYDNCHLPLALRTFPQILEHRRNYPEEGGLFFAPDAGPVPWDVITEIWFADRAGFEALLAHVADPVANAEIAADEERFLDRGRCGMMIVDEAVARRE